TGRFDLGDLLAHLATLRDREIAEAEAATGGAEEGVVNLNTVHGAKGLEYPVVILADVGRGPAGGRETFLFDGDDGLAVKVRHPLEGVGHAPAGYEALREEEKEREAEEDLRLLYVAMTRAEERLLLVGTCAGLTKKDGRPARFLGWGKALLEAFTTTPTREADVVEMGEGTA
ncbi:MAG: 3'-5' exonuclease, partial [Planctomycetota bacterium]